MNEHAGLTIDDAIAYAEAMRNEINGLIVPRRSDRLVVLLLEEIEKLRDKVLQHEMGAMGWP